MALDDDIRILSGVRLFDGFTAEQLRLLAFGAEQIGLPAGRRLFREDDEADTAYVVVSGTISLFREGDEDRLTVAPDCRHAPAYQRGGGRRHGTAAAHPKNVSPYP
jgi:hypothetical protein